MNTVIPNEISNEIPIDIDDEGNSDSTYLNPEEFASRVNPKRSPYLLVWDSNGKRLANRINALIKNGFLPMGAPFSHIMHQQNNPESTKSVICQAVLHNNYMDDVK